MNPGAGPRISDRCPSDFELDRWVAGGHSALPDAHLSSCERCTARLALLRASREQAAPRVEMLLARAREARAATPGPPSVVSRPARWFPMGLAGVGLAVVFLLMGVPTGEELAPGIRIKGTSLRFFVQRGGEVSPARSGDDFAAGDALRFVRSNGERRHFILVGVDPAGRVTAYHPYNGARSVEVPPGIEVPLPGSLVLDEARGTEYFLGIFSEEGLQLDRIDAAIAAVRRAHGSALNDLRRVDLPGSHHWVVVNKP